MDKPATAKFFGGWSALLMTVFFLWGSPSFASAPKVFVSPEKTAVVSGQTFSVDVLLDTSGAEINAIEGKLDFPFDKLELVGVSSAKTFISFWVTAPECRTCQSGKGEIDFAGIVPGGYAGDHGQVLSVELRAKGEGQGALGLKEVRVLLNDGKGTDTKATAVAGSFVTAAGTPPSAVSPPEDTESPESFTPVIAQDPQVFDGQLFLVFYTQDKGSGLDHYDVYEGSSANPAPADPGWRKVTSPYVLQDQTRGSYVIVRAADKSGNQTLATVPPVPRGEHYATQILVAAVIFLTVIVIILSAIIWKISRKKR